MPYLRAKIFDTTYDCRAACGRLVRFSLAIGLLALVVPFDVKGQDTQDDLETLKSIEDELSRAQDAQSERMRDRSALEQDALTIQNELVETARAIQELEQELTLSEIRLTELIEEEERVTSQLAERRHDIAELLGGMQILARQNPPALLVSPDDAVRAVRSAILLEDVTPEFLERANQLERELVQLKAVREQIIAEQAQLSARYAAFEDQDEVLRGLLAERQTARAALSEMILSEERRIAALVGQASTIRALIANLPPGTADGEDTGAAAQAPRLAEAMGRLPLPVKGQIETVFGEPVESGELSSGITISARDGAQVIAPFDGRIAFAGPFLDYQQLLLMDAGEGYHFLFIGMARLYGRVGDRLLAGEPIGVMGSSMQDEETGDIEAPTLYIEFRKDGEPINPLPWLAATERKVSG